MRLDIDLQQGLHVKVVSSDSRSFAMTEPLPGDDMHPQVMQADGQAASSGVLQAGELQALMHVVQLTSQKEGRPEEDVSFVPCSHLIEHAACVFLEYPLDRTCWRSSQPRRV